MPTHMPTHSQRGACNSNNAHRRGMAVIPAAGSTLATLPRGGSWLPYRQSASSCFSLGSICRTLALYWGSLACSGKTVGGRHHGTPYMLGCGIQNPNAPAARCPPVGGPGGQRRSAPLAHPDAPHA